MVALRSRRLETLLGARLDEVAAAGIRSLVDARVAESFDLDFKESTYGSSDRHKRDLATDVAAIANTAGGIILIGVKENKQAQATAAPGVEVTDQEIGRILQIIAAKVSPMPQLDVIPVYAEDATGDPAAPRPGFLMIAIARGTATPHAVLDGVTLRYPKRNGSTTRYLSEPEVAAAYLDRSAGAARRRERLDAIEADALDRLNPDGDAWIVLSLVPDVAGETRVTRQAVEALRGTSGLRPMVIGDPETLRRRLRIAQGQFVIDDTIRTSTPDSAFLGLHSDGSGVYAMRVANLLQDQAAAAAPNRMVLEDEMITLAILSGLVELGEHALQAGASGNAILRARISPSRNFNEIELGRLRVTGVSSLNGGRIPSLPHPVAETVVTLDELAPAGEDLIKAATGVIDQLAQALGVAQLDQVSPEGTINSARWTPFHSTRAQVIEWATKNGIEVSE